MRRGRALSLCGVYPVAFGQRALRDCFAGGVTVGDAPVPVLRLNAIWGTDYGCCARLIRAEVGSGHARFQDDKKERVLCREGGTRSVYG